MKLSSITIILVIILSGAVRADDQPPPENSINTDDTLAVNSGHSVKNPLYANQPRDTLKVTQNPTRALFKSMFVPGWGQFGNHKYIKAGVIAGLEVTLIGTIIHYSKKKSDFEDRYKAETDETEQLRLFNAFRDAKDQRNRFSWYLGSLIFLSMFDAYVDAHLARFPKISKNISFDLKPVGLQDLALTVIYNF